MSLIRMLVVVVTVLVFTGCAQRLPYEQAQQSYAAGDYRQALDVFTQYANSGSPLRYQALYYQGMSEYNLGLCAESVKSFKTVIDFSKDRQLRASALEALGKSYLKLGKSKDSEQCYSDLLDKYEDIYPQDQALVGIITALKVGGDAAGALEYEQRLAKDFPNNLQSRGSSAIGAIYRIRLKRHFIRKSAAQAEIEKLKKQGFETALFREFARGGDRFIVQVGAFSSPASAKARADSVSSAGWDVEIVRK